MKDYEVGDVFNFGQKKIKCVESNKLCSCTGCMFRYAPERETCEYLRENFIGNCRPNKTRGQIIFIEVKEEETT